MYAIRSYYVPLALPVLLTGISVTFWDIAAGLVYLILIPLAISLFVRARYPDAAASAQPMFAQVSNLSLMILLVLMIVLNFRITSYNVCYTKLLRRGHGLRNRPAATLQSHSGAARRPGGRIALRPRHTHIRRANPPRPAPW